MNARRSLPLLLIACASLASAAPTPPPPPPALPYPDEVPPVYSEKDKAALAIAQDWKNAPTVPATGSEGRVLFRFGETLPTVVCSPTQVTDIELEPGETVKPEGMHLGDTVRWAVLPAVSGPEGATTTHLICKPQGPNLTTSLVCTTDRRVYHVRLVSTAVLDEWMPYVAFSYPENQARQWAAYAVQQQKARERATIPDAVGPGKGATLGELDFGYKIEGKNVPWLPVRCYNDGVKTVIQMPRAMIQTEAPALLVIGADRKEQLVNYRLHNDRFIVDQLFGKAVLISGVGRKQVRVTITRTGPATSTSGDTAGIQHRR